MSSKVSGGILVFFSSSGIGFPSASNCGYG